MTDVTLKVVGLGKQYRIGQKKEKYKTLRESISNAALAPLRIARSLKSGGAPATNVFWALNDVSFEVRRGEVIGVVGRNGAGKSTLLKILSRITEPSTGYVDLHGRVASLLEVGTGFHPELTGRENILLNGAILGMKRAEIERKFDEIVSFAEVEDFIDTPVKHYSSGMYLRLAFAVAAHLEPEILLVDEVLAVGDAAFQKKCLGKMGDVARNGRTILFVSHNLGAMSALCQRGILLEKGQVASIGDISQVIGTYLSSLQQTSSISLRERTDRGGTGKARITSVVITDGQGRSIQQVISGQECLLAIEYQAAKPLTNPVFKATIYNSAGQPLTNFDSSVVHAPYADLPSQGTVRCQLRRLPLAHGKYWMNVSLENNQQILDHVTAAYSFDVGRGDFYGTGRNVKGISEICLVDQEWQRHQELVAG